MDIRKLAIETLRKHNRRMGEEVKSKITLKMGEEKGSNSITYSWESSLTECAREGQVSDYLESMALAGEASQGFNHKLDGAKGTQTHTTTGILQAMAACEVYSVYKDTIVSFPSKDRLEEEAYDRMIERERLAKLQAEAEAKAKEEADKTAERAAHAAKLVENRNGQPGSQASSNGKPQTAGTKS